MKVAVLNNGYIRESAMDENIMSKMDKYGIERADSLEESDYLIYITCAGVGDTIKKNLQELQFLDYYSKEKDFKIIIVGCLVINHGYLFDRFKDNDNIKIINNKEWVIPVINYINDMNKRNTFKEKLLNRTCHLDRVNVGIQFMMQEGCTNKCTFCKVHYLDHELSSVPYELALNYLTDLIRKKGTKQIALNGDNLTLYGLDLYGKKRLHEFIHDLSRVEGLEMISLNELVIGDMYKELLDEIITNPKVVSVGLQLETASNRLLKLMNRNYSIEEYDYYARKIIESGKYVDTIIMSGFPTETIEDMEYTINYIKDRRIITYGICEYSDFKYIPSSKLEQFSKREKRKHTNYLVDAKFKINYDIFLEEMPKQTKLIYKEGVNGIHFISNAIPGITTISYSDRFDDLKPGDIINEAPKRLVKNNKYTKKMTYKI